MTGAIQSSNGSDTANALAAIPTTKRVGAAHLRVNSGETIRRRHDAEPASPHHAPAEFLPSPWIERSSSRGAIRPDSNVSISRPVNDNKTSPELLAAARLGGKQNIGEQFWHDQQSHRADENPGGENWISSAGHFGNRENPFGKYSGRMK